MLSGVSAHSAFIRYDESRCPVRVRASWMWDRSERILRSAKCQDMHSGVVGRALAAPRHTFEKRCDRSRGIKADAHPSRFAMS